MEATVWDEWNILEKEIRDGLINRDSARKWIVELNFAMQEIYSGRIGRSSFHLPLKAMVKSIGGRNGNGYRPAGYDFYDGNRHTGHPAQDIFIFDPDGTGMGRRTGKPVDVVAFED